MAVVISNQKPQNDQTLVVSGDQNANGAVFYTYSATKVCLVPFLRALAEMSEEDFREAYDEALDFALDHKLNLTIDVDSLATYEEKAYALSVALEQTFSYFGKRKADLDVTLFCDVDKHKVKFVPSESSEKACRIVIQNSYIEDSHFRREFDHFCRKLDAEITFRELLREFMVKKGIKTRSELYTRAGVSKETFSKIMNEANNPMLQTYRPSKETVYALAVGLRLNIKEAEEFFHAAGYHLGAEDLPDKVFRFYVGEKHIYDIFEINSCLLSYGYAPWGTQSRDDMAMYRIN